MMAEPKPLKRQYGVPVLVLVLSLSFTLLVWHVADSASDAKVQARFDQEIHDVSDAISARIRLYENTLYGAQGLFEASEGVSRTEFRNFVERQRVQVRFPGVQCIGYSRIVPAQGLKALEESVHAEGIPHFHVHPAYPRDVYHTILYIEPFEGRNLRAFGFDMYSEPVRRAAMDFACDNDAIGFTGRVKLLQETEVAVQPGVLMYLPIYRRSEPRGTVEQRRKALTGFVYAAFRMNDLMSGVLNSQNTMTLLDIYDSPECNPDGQLYGSGETVSVSHGDRLARDVTVRLYNREWTLRFHARPELIVEAHGVVPSVLLFCGCIISVLLFLIALSLNRLGRRAQTLAREMTEKLRESEESARLMVESVKDYAIIQLDASGKIAHWNAGAERLEGYTSEEVLGKSLDLFYRSEDRLSGLPQALLERALQTGRAADEGWRVRKDGRQFWAEVLITAVRGPDGALRGFTKITRDVTARREASIRLDQALAFQHVVLNSANYSIIATDPQGIIRLFNRAAETILGYSAEDVIGRSTPAIFHDSAEMVAHAAILSEEFGRHIEPGFEVFVARARTGAVDEREWTYIRKDGSRLPVLLSVTSLHAPDGGISGFMGIATDLTERKLAEERARRALHELEMQKFALDQHAIVAVTDTRGRISYANDRFCAISKYAREELIGQDHRIIKSGVHSRAFFATMWKTIAHGAVWHGEICNRAKDGTLYWVDSSIVPMKDPAGRVEAYVSIRTDITERKAAEDVSRERKEQMRLTLEAAEIGTWDVDLVKGVSHWGGSHGILFGLASNEEFDGHQESFYSFVLPEDRGIVEAGVRDAIASRGLAMMEYRIRRKDTGELRWMASRGRILFDGEDKPVRMAGIVRDVTKRRMAEESLREKSLAMEHAVEGIVLLDTEACFVEANRAFAALAGCDTSDLPGVGLATLINPVEWPAVSSAIESMWTSGKSEIECCGLRKDGLPFYMHCVFARTGADRSGGFYCFAKDITERKRAEEALRAAREETDAVNQHLAVMNQQLEEAIQKANEMAMRAEYANQAKSEFLATMSHEIRTPMNGIIGFTTLLCETELNSEQRDFAETIRNSGQALLTLINDILDFSKIEAGKLTVEAAPFDVRLAVEEVAELLTNNAEARGLELLLNIEASCPRELVGDSSRVRQILLNLIGNAIKFTHEGHVLVDVRCESVAKDARRFVRFAIVDTGIGIPESKQRQLFQPFTQADASTTRHYGGTGLGLAICKRLVELLGGTIGLDSMPGRGSTFWFLLPAPVDAQPAAGVLASPDEFAGRRILLAHPYPLARGMLAAQLQSWRADVSACGKSEEGASLLRISGESGRPFDIVLATLEMQQAMDAELNAQRALGRGSAVVVVSRSTQRADVRRRLGQSLQAQLQNPIVRPAALAVALRTGVQALGGSVPREKTQPVRTTAMVDEQTSAVRYRVLLADDNIVNQKLAVKMLEKLACSVDLACNGREAVELAQQLPYDVIFMDCHMPEMDGFEATAEIRRLSANGRRVPIIAVTADALQGDRERCLSAGMDGYISKPIKRDDLLRALEQWCATVSCK